MSTLALGGARRTRMAGPAAALGVLAVAGWVAVGAHAGHVLDALPDTLRAGVPAVALFALCGYGVARAALPERMLPHLALMVLPLGAVSSSLLLTALGLARVPFDFALVLVLAAGAAGSVIAHLRLGPARPREEHLDGAGGIDLRALWPAYLALALVALSLLPAFRVGNVAVLGQNPDAHLVTGAAEVVRAGSAQDVIPDLPVDRVSPYWSSKYPIFYSLAAVSSLSGLDPIRVFPVLSGIMLALFAAGAMVLAFYALGAGPVVAVAAMGLAPLDRVITYVAVHPYYNQLWGTFALPFILAFGLLYLRERTWRWGLLFALFLAIGAFAYPLMLPFPLVGVGLTALLDRRRRKRAGEPVARIPRSPLSARGWRRGIAIAAAVPVGLLVVVLGLGVLEKGLRGFQAFIPTTPLNGWQGDSPDYPFSYHFGMPDVKLLGVLMVGALCAACWPALRELRREERIGLLAMAAGAALAALSFTLRDYGQYLVFKTLAFLGPLVAIVAVVGLGRLIARSAGRARVLAASVLAALALVWLVGTRVEIEPFPQQVSPDLFALRGWPSALPPGASIRLDVPPSGLQLWTAYMLHRSPLSSLAPVTGTTYPALPYGRRADYVILSRGIPTPREAVGRPVRRNGTFRLYRLGPLPGRDNSSRERIQPKISNGGA